MPIYLIQAADQNLYKLGFAKNVENRLATLRTASPHPLRVLQSWAAGTAAAPSSGEPAAEDSDGSPAAIERAVEANMHRRWATHRQAGEWFRWTASELSEVRAVVPGEIMRLDRLARDVGRLAREKPSLGVAPPSDASKALVIKLRELRALREMVDAEIEGLELELKLLVGAAEGIEGIATWSWQERTIVDQQKLKEGFREVYEACAKTSATRVFRLKAGG